MPCISTNNHNTVEVDRTRRSNHLVVFLLSLYLLFPIVTMKRIAPVYDPEVLGGDTCDLGECCINPCGYLWSRFSRAHSSAGILPRIGNACAERGMQILYVTVTHGCWAVVFWKIYPLIRQSPTIPDYHLTTGHVVFFFCLYSWIKATFTGPGKITRETLHHYDNYHYDNVLYADQILCPTLHFRKLARSKYDRHTDTHVPRFDHHCTVLKQSVGEENYRDFLAFLIIHTAMCWYGVNIFWRLLTEGSEEKPLDEVVPSVPARPGFAATALAKTSLTTLLCVIAFAAIGLSAFVGFHFYLVTHGMTTNEYYKWKALSAQHAKDCKMHKKSESSIDTECAATRHYGPSPFPANTYNLGVFANTIEVIFPRSLYSSGRKNSHQS